MRNKRACLVGSLHLSLAGNVPLTGLYPAPRHSTPSQHDTPCHAAQLVVVFFFFCGLFYNAASIAGYAACRVK